MQKRRKHIAAQKSKERRPRVNEEIRADPVLLVHNEESTEMALSDALKKAELMEMDLIEVSPKARPPVVKIGDFGQYLYQLKKKERKQKAHNKQTEVKTLRFGFRTDQHDLNRLLDRARGFLEERHLVKFIVRLRGRELTNKDYARTKLKDLVTTLLDVADVEQDLKPQGNQFSMIVRPKK